MLKFKLLIGIAGLLLCSFHTNRSLQTDYFCEYIVKHSSPHLSCTLIEGTFEGLHRSEDPTPDTLLHIFNSPSINLRYHENYGTGGGFDVLGKRFLLGKDHSNKGAYMSPTHPGFNIDTNLAKVYSLVLKSGKKYLLIMSSGKAEYEMGSNQIIVLYSLFDVTDAAAPRYYMLRSRYGCINNIGDFNNDGKLDFIELEYKNDVSDKENEQGFRLKALTLVNDDFVAMTDQAGKKYEVIFNRRLVNNKTYDFKIVREYWWQ